MRLLPAFMLAASLGVGGLWALSTRPAPSRGAPAEENEQKKKQQESSACSNCGDVAWCADVSCAAEDCVEVGSMMLDCSSCEGAGCAACEVAECAACDCGSCAILGATSMGTAAVGASCPPARGGAPFSLLLLAAPALVLAGWRARCARS